MRKLLARLALFVGLALLAGSSGGATAGVFEDRKAIDIQFMFYEANDDGNGQGECYYECTVEITTYQDVMDGDGVWHTERSVAYGGEGVITPANADGQTCTQPEYMPAVRECPSGR